MEGVKMAGTLKTEKSVEQRTFRCAGKEEVNRKWHEKKLYGQFVREMLETVDKEKSWRSWRSCAESPLCRMCNEKGKTVQHTVSECKKLAQHEYKTKR